MMNGTYKLFLAVLATLALPLLDLDLGGKVSASPVAYHVAVNTSTVSGTMGSLEFQFNPGGFNSLAATATITNFMGGTLVGSPSNIGNVSGALPGPVAINNGTAFNDMLQNFNYSAGFSFDVTFSGPALDTPDPSKPGTTFSLTLWDMPDGGGDPIFPVDESGAALLININPDGSRSVTSAPQVNVTPIPEPTSLVLFGVGLAGLAVYRRWRGKQPA
jgi:hypothetical protein